MAGNSGLNVTDFRMVRKAAHVLAERGQGQSRKYITQSIDASQKRLDTDFHRAVSELPPEIVRAVGALISSRGLANSVIGLWLARTRPCSPSNDRLLTMDDFSGSSEQSLVQFLPVRDVQACTRRLSNSWRRSRIV